MKPSAEDWNSPDKLDKLLFDYLEGNLAEEQVRELEQKAATEMLLRSEMEAWKETILVQDLYDTSQLEQTLLLPETAGIHTHETTGTSLSATRLFLFAVLVCLNSLWPAKMNKHISQAAPGMAIQATVQENNSDVFPVGESAAYEAAGNVDAPTERRRIASVTEPSPALTKHTPMAPLSRLSLTPLPARNEIPPVILPEAAQKTIKVPKLAVPRLISRKQARQIARMKERALQRRMANEFLKGRVPYVVPLNTRNF